MGDRLLVSFRLGGIDRTTRARLWDSLATEAMGRMGADRFSIETEVLHPTRTHLPRRGVHPVRAGMFSFSR